MYIWITGQWFPGTIQLLHLSSIDADTGVFFASFFQKLTISSSVLLTLSSRLFSVHYSARSLIPSQYILSLLFIVWQIMINYLGSVCEEVPYPSEDCCTQAQNLRCWAEINKQLDFDVTVVIFRVCEDWGEGNGYGVLCGSVCSESLHPGRNFPLVSFSWLYWIGQFLRQEAGMRERADDMQQKGQKSDSNPEPVRGNGLST